MLMRCAFALLADHPRRRDDPDQALLRRLRTHTNVPRREQKVQHALLPQPGAHRRREPQILQTAGNHHFVSRSASIRTLPAPLEGLAHTSHWPNYSRIPEN